jgi:hypothetical protein
MNAYFTSIPRPGLNGGHYTGEPFEKNAPWGTVPVIPDTTFMIHYNLSSANPPPGANVQYIGYDRPGNNKTYMLGVSPPHNMAYNHMRFIDNTQQPSPCTCTRCMSSKYYYL